MVIFQKRVAGLTPPALSRFLARARRAVGLRGTVNVLVTTNAEMRSLNGRFRKKEEPTDVLSFSAGPEGATKFAGDIAISATIAAENARLFGHPVSQEIKILVLHGVLHLRGYNHERDRGEMGRREIELRRALGLPVGLIERTAFRSHRGFPLDPRRGRR